MCYIFSKRNFMDTYPLLTPQDSLYYNVPIDFLTISYKIVLEYINEYSMYLLQLLYHIQEHSYMIISNIPH